MVKNLPAMQETWVWSLGQEDPLEKEMATPQQYSCLENPMDRRAWWAIVSAVTKESDDLATKQQQLYDLQKVHFSSSSCCFWLVLYSVPTYLSIFGGTLKHAFIYTMTWRNFEYSSIFGKNNISLVHQVILSSYGSIIFLSLSNWLLLHPMATAIPLKTGQEYRIKHAEEATEPTDNIMGILSLIS